MKKPKTAAPIELPLNTPLVDTGVAQFLFWNKMFHGTIVHETGELCASKVLLDMGYQVNKMRARTRALDLKINCGDDKWTPIQVKSAQMGKGPYDIPNIEYPDNLIFAFILITTDLQSWDWAFIPRRIVLEERARTSTTWAHNQIKKGTLGKIIERPHVHISWAMKFKGQTDCLPPLIVAKVTP